MYEVLETVKALADSVVVGQSWQKDERILLFVVLQPDHLLDEQLTKEIRQLLRKKLSPRHVPAKIISIREVPYTFNNKKAEISVKRAVEGKTITNLSALRNPNSIDDIIALSDQWQD